MSGGSNGTFGSNVSIGLDIGKVSQTDSIMGTDAVDPNVLVTGVGSSRKNTFPTPSCVLIHRLKKFVDAAEFL
jgi:hypothetical protein